MTLGANWMKEMHAVIDIGQQVLKFDYRGRKYQIKVISFEQKKKKKVTIQEEYASSEESTTEEEEEDSEDDNDPRLQP